MTTQYPKGNELFVQTFNLLHTLQTKYWTKEHNYTLDSNVNATLKRYQISYLYTFLARAVNKQFLPRIDRYLNLLKYPFPILSLGDNHHLYLSQRITLLSQYHDIVLEEIEDGISKQIRSIVEGNCEEQDLEELDELEHIITRTFDDIVIELSFQGIIHRDEVVGPSASLDNIFALILSPEEIEQANTNNYAHELSGGIHYLEEIKQNRRDAGIRR